MAKFTNPLDHVKIAAPCSADWNQMFSFEGERVRFCSQCNQNVYNLSAMTRSEAEALLTSTEGRLCVRYYRRSDGTILTQNCAVGLKAIKRRAVWVAQAILGMVLTLLAGIGLNSITPGEELLGTDSLNAHPIDPPPELTSCEGAADLGMTIRPIEHPIKPKSAQGIKTRKIEQGRIVHSRRDAADQ